MFNQGSNGITVLCEKIHYKRARKTAVKIIQMHLPLRDGGDLDHGTGRRNGHRFRVGCGCKNSKTSWGIRERRCPGILPDLKLETLT